MDSLISNCNRDFGNKNGVNQKYLFVLGLLFGLVNGFSRFLWGYLMDKIGFKPLMSFISTVEVIVAGSFYYSAKFDLIYVISVLFIAACIGGHFSTLPPLFKKVYGLEIGPQIYGLCGFFVGTANLTGPLLTAFFLKEKKDYLITFLIGGSLVMIKIFCLLMFDENEKFKLDDVVIDEDIGKIEEDKKEE